MAFRNLSNKLQQRWRWSRCSNQIPTIRLPNVSDSNIFVHNVKSLSTITQSSMQHNKQLCSSISHQLKRHFSSVTNDSSNSNSNSNNDDSNRNTNMNTNENFEEIDAPNISVSDAVIVSGKNQKSLVAVNDKKYGPIVPYIGETLILPVNKPIFPGFAGILQIDDLGLKTHLLRQYRKRKKILDSGNNLDNSTKNLEWIGVFLHNPTKQTKLIQEQLKKAKSDEQMKKEKEEHFKKYNARLKQHQENDKKAQKSQSETVNTNTNTNTNINVNINAATANTNATTNINEKTENENENQNQDQTINVNATSTTPIDKSQNLQQQDIVANIQNGQQPIETVTADSATIDTSADEKGTPIIARAGHTSRDDEIPWNNALDEPNVDILIRVPGNATGFDEVFEYGTLVKIDFGAQATNIASFDEFEQREFGNIYDKKKSGAESVTEAQEDATLEQQQTPQQEQVQTQSVESDQNIENNEKKQNDASEQSGASHGSSRPSRASIFDVLSFDDPMYIKVVGGRRIRVDTMSRSDPLIANIVHLEPQLTKELSLTELELNKADSNNVKTDEITWDGSINGASEIGVNGDTAADADVVTDDSSGVNRKTDVTPIDYSQSGVETRSQFTLALELIRCILREDPDNREDLMNLFRSRHAIDFGFFADYAACTTNSTPRELQSMLESVSYNERLNKLIVLLKREIRMIDTREQIIKDVDSMISKEKSEKYLSMILNATKRKLGFDQFGPGGGGPVILASARGGPAGMQLAQIFDVGNGGSGGSDGNGSDAFGAALGALGKEGKKANRYERLAKKFKKRIEKKTLPREVMELFNEGIEKLESKKNSMMEGGADLETTKQYLDWISSLPWNTYSIDNTNIKKAKQILDDSHFGMLDVKERILEIIACTMLRGDNMISANQSAASQTLAKSTFGGNVNEHENDQTHPDSKIKSNAVSDGIDDTSEKMEDNQTDDFVNASEIDNDGDLEDDLQEEQNQKAKRGVTGQKILCLVGPPGVGKTSIGESVAEALNKKFFKFSLGGSDDSHMIKGFLRTYVGSNPGKLIYGLKQCQTSNPVILIDEIDKIGARHSDPSHALLEVLDPSQNHEFTDNYLDFPVDLSNVTFVCTANDESTINPTLKDRLHVVRLSGYDYKEKLNIAKQYLIPKALKKCGLLEKNVSLSDDVIEELIRWYCRESGVRSLEQHIERIFSKCALMLAEAGVTHDEIHKITNENTTTEWEPNDDTCENESNTKATTPSTTTEANPQSNKTGENAQISAAEKTDSDGEEKALTTILGSLSGFIKRLGRSTATKPTTSTSTSTSSTSSSSSSTSGNSGMEIESTGVVGAQNVENQEKEEQSVPFINVSVSNLKDFVGPRIFSHDRTFENDDYTPSGVVTGLAYTTMGGSTTYIETVKYRKEEGKGGSLKSTGKLGKVMTESTEIAYSVARAMLFNHIDQNNNFFNDFHIHLHAPEGGISKDGPSAGITIVTALLSLALDNKISSDVAMTGEVTLTGKVLKIGGIREKMLAAKRANIKELIFPFDNKDEYFDDKTVPEYLRNEFEKVHFVKHYTDVLTILFKDNMDGGIRNNANDGRLGQDVLEGINAKDSSDTVFASDDPKKPHIINRNTQSGEVSSVAK